jgi:hypothetical protein
MENRIKRLEAVIVAAGLNAQSNRGSPTETNDTLPDNTNVTDRLSSLLIDDDGNSNFLGELNKSDNPQKEC